MSSIDNDSDIPSYSGADKFLKVLTLFCLAMRQVNSLAVLSGLEDLTTTDITGSEIEEIPKTRPFNVLFSNFLKFSCNLLGLLTFWSEELLKFTW